MKEYVAFHTSEKRILSLMSLKSLEETLPDDEFIRVHRSFIVNLEKVEAKKSSTILIKERQIPIGAKYKSQIIDRLF